VIRAIARFSVGNSVAVNLATFSVLMAGILAFLAMPREVFPEFSLGSVTITTLYPGSAPEDVERLVTLPLEGEFEGIDGLKDMTSVSQEGYSLVTLTARAGTDMRRFVDDVRAGVQGGDLELPEAAEDPRVREIKSEFPAIGIFVFGHVDDEELRLLAERLERDLEKIDGVSQVFVQGTREPRIWVEVDPVSLERYGLSLAQVGRAVGARSSDHPLGSLAADSGDYLLRVMGEVHRAEDLRDLPVRRHPDGTTLRLAEVARVIDTFERPITKARFNGEPCVYLKVNKSSDGDAMDISRDVHAYLEGEQSRLPAGVALGTNSDLSVYIRNRLSTMRDSATLGGILVLISLLLFLNLRVALVTALGIPISFLGGLLLAYSFGISMNMMTMFALIIVLGMIVDDAIVVGENAFRLMEEGLSPVQAAIQGTAEVGKPVLATILTTIAAFLPVLAIGGTMGQFMRPLPLIVTFCLLVSLAEALFVLPAHLAHWTRPVERKEVAAPRRWYDPLRDRYVDALAFCLRWRYVTLAVTFTVTVLLIGVARYRMPFLLFDDFESKVFSINIRTAPGSSVEESEEIARGIEAVVLELPEGEFESSNMIAGVSYVDASRYSVGQNLAQVWVELREDTSGRRPTSEIIEGLRARFSVLPEGVESLDISQPQAGPTGRAIDVAVRGPRIAVLEEIAEEIQEFLASFRGVRDIHDNLEPGKREIAIRLHEAGRTLGFDEASLGAELRSAFEGTRCGRIRRGKDDVEIIVKLPEEMRERRGDLEALLVGAPGGGSPVPLGMIAELEERPGPSVISRDGGERSVRIIADVNKQEGNTGEITARLMARYADLGDRYPGYSLEFKGEHEDAQESFQGIKIALLFALFPIYMILGSLFRSITQPAVIMCAVPFGSIGMILGHLAMGRAISFLSLIGFVALTGIVVNDSLILIDFVNNRRREGRGLTEALLTAGRQRFRPILLTTITTMVGLSPLALFASGQARFLQPMAITIFFGLCSSTVLILIVIPCAYAALEDLLATGRRLLRLGPPRDFSIEPRPLDSREPS
jgi:multidrug efflux pump subunit AcrB